VVIARGPAHPALMLYTGAGSDETTDEHEGYVAGRRTDGTATGIWTDVTRCGVDLTGYVPACECGWAGEPHPADRAGFAAAERAWLDGHFRGVLRERLGRDVVLTERDFLGRAPHRVH
jgi:hypothetical protein